MTSGQRSKLIYPPPWLAAAVALTLALAAVAGCSSKRDLTPEQQAQADVTAYEQEIRKVIPAPARADQLVALTNEFQQLATESIASVKNYRAKLAALNSNYDATRADYETLFREQDASREAFLKKAGALRERMAVFTNDSEWEQLKKARLRALDADLEELLS
jgi:uncharacterized coiled-coil DUF342 family protein